jgi:hypothetical protein
MINEISNQGILKLLDSREKPIALDSSEGKKIVAESRRRVILQVLKFFYDRLINSIHLKSRLKSNSDVLNLHESFYKMSVDEYLGMFSDQLLNSSYFRIDYRIAVHCNNARMMVCNRSVIGNLIEQLSPRNICEVGSGAGATLYYLASRFPNIQFSGYELAQSGVELCNRLQEHGLYGTSYGQAYNLPPGSDDLVRQIKFYCASAYALTQQSPI